MKLQQPVILIAIIFAAFIAPAGSVFAEPLYYMGNRRNDLVPGNQMEESQGQVVPVSYGTNYDTQFPAYASFMQSPYGPSNYSQGGMQQQYGTGMPYFVPAASPAGNPATANSRDPLNASEVSPYSHYSPYMEVVGEGSNYTLGIDDVVTIVVRNQPDFSGRFVVDPEGNIQYNFVGDIPSVGKNKQALKQEIISRLSRFVRYPEVAVMISEYRSKAVYVFGFINRPGKYAMKGDQITVKEAVVAAGLPRMDGSMKKVFVIRANQKDKEGNPVQKKVNLQKLLIKGDAAEDFVLEPGDTIVVNQRHFDRFVNAYSRLIGPMFQTAAVYELGFGGDPNGYLRKNPK